MTLLLICVIRIVFSKTCVSKLQVYFVVLVRLINDLVRVISS